MVMRALLAAVICVVAGCTTFEDPSIVLDLRVIAMTASFDTDGRPPPTDASQTESSGPEQVIGIDFEHPNVQTILAQIQPVWIRAFIADPAAHRSLKWKMTLCILGMDDRCDLDHPVIEMGSAVISDPEDSLSAQQPTAELLPDQKLLAILREAVEANPVQALGGIEYGVVIEVSDLADPTQIVYGAKHLRLAGRTPPDRSANVNPFLSYLDAAIQSIGIIIPHCRCSQHELAGCNIPEIDAGTVVTLFPVEPTSIRQEYTAPTLSGGSETLTETITYQWLAGEGGFSDETTGGGHDVLGNQSLLGTEWRAPKKVSTDVYVPIWMIQRDERYGANVLETCMHVVPPL
jgi:hypothetical protein